MYLISNLASKTGISKDTLNYYLNIGLIKETTRIPDLEYRIFNDSVVERLNRIKELRQKGYSIKKIQHMLGG
ncbi:MAG: MerR family transcriptional regulator [Candidatus Eremiobacterota bacterium]|jgi:DNA-binding transcriptional MerR regulator